jgi:uncharacterized protein YbgA (DUF1722 family)
MRAHHTPTQDRQTTLSHVLNHCEEKLSLLTHTVRKQQWQSLAQAIQSYENAIHQLESSMRNNTELPASLLHQLQYLSIQQRRVMRVIHQYMQQAADDIQSIDKGIAKLQQTARLQADRAAQVS